MDLIINKQGITFIGKVKNLENIFSSWPGDMTLLDFIRLHYH